MSVIPSSLRIGGFDWLIEENAEVTNEGNAFGTTHHGKQRMFIDPSETQQKKKHTLVHEIMHAIWWQSGLGVRYGEKNHPKLEEEVVAALSMGMYQVLRDNPQLNEWSNSEVR